ncbi:YIP1 family protein [Fertoebacter nigrum]|uniref:YIP1 family protein n=1 Tax=Fertoeibacter niger TaxID=2656921 RepID=A0A8X8KNA1_9RHOB|nr:Yip1 family protein [Fertoeibacter niger]NUB43815.1 YIP1 family protein [Fertoeibacter niger]
MELNLGNLLRLARFTVQNPQRGAQAVLAINPPDQARWLAFLLTAALSAIMTALSVALLPPDLRAAMGGQLANPLVSAALQAGVLLLAVQAIHHVGRWRGGTGTFADALLLVVWLQFILLCLQAVQLVAQVLLPPLADMVGIFALVLFFWLLTNFVTALHGFRSRLAVFGGIIAVTVLLAFALAILLIPFMPALPPGV